tara:strand:+ start:413 stop:1258 length:846 start_codon:yes stop_codon:yes gene_type:complete
MIRIVIFVILTMVYSSIYAEDQTAPEPLQIEPEVEAVNELPSPDDMMLIWPKIPPSGDPKEVKKAIESQRLLDKIKHGAVALNTKNGKKPSNKISGIEKSGSKIHVQSGFSLANVLSKMSGRGHIPPILIEDPTHRLWHERVWFTYKNEVDPIKLLNRIAKSYEFLARKDENFYALSSKVFNKRAYKPVSINAEKISLITLIKSILKSAGLNGVISEQLRDFLVTVQLKKVSAFQALEAIVKANNLEHRIIGDIHVIHPGKNSKFKTHKHRELKKIKKKLN